MEVLALFRISSQTNQLPPPLLERRLDDHLTPRPCGVVHLRRPRLVRCELVPSRTPALAPLTALPTLSTLPALFVLPALMALLVLL